MKAGIWIDTVHLGSVSGIEEALKKLKDTGFSLIIPCVKDTDGLLDYHSKVGKIRDKFKNWDPLEKICEFASKLNLKVHPWLCVFTEGSSSKLIEKNQSLWLTDSEGKRDSRWVCAMNPEVQEYEYSLYEEILENYPVDGVHLDYIRTGPFCYCDYCNSRIKEKTGKSLFEIKPNETGRDFEIWMKWREKNITEFVGKVSKKAKELEKEVSAAVFRDYPSCVESQGQNWKDWVERKFVDYIIPMTYTNNLTLFKEYSKIHKMVTGDNAYLLEGIGRESSMSNLDKKQLEEQIKSIKEMNIEGVVIYSYSGLQESDFEIFKKYF